jgi:kynurenine formamidase
MTNPKKLIDLSHTIFDGLVTYKGLPPPVICDYLSREESRKFYEPGTEFQIGKIEMVTNTGTYLDCPFHRYSDGKDLSELALEQCTDLEAVTIDAVNVMEIDVEFFSGVVLTNKAVIIHTGWSRHWDTEQYFENHPFVTKQAAEFLRNNHVKLVGIDSHNIDDTRGNARPVHSTLLAAGILIVEHLCNLNQLPESNYQFTAAPPKVRGAGTFPVRAFARV